MRIVESITEREMVAHFLRTEIQSERFVESILALLTRDGRDRSVVGHPCLSDAADNAYRDRLLGDFRGYRQQRELFLDYPDDVAWYRATISREELARVRYIEYSYWNELSGGSRLPGDAAGAIRAGIEIWEVPNDRFWRAAQAIREGVALPELIFGGNFS